MDDTWVGEDEAEGIPVQPRKDVKPPPHWRLEAVAATERPRSLRLGEDRRTAVYIHDRDTSDVCLLDLHDPSRVVHRALDAIFEPEETWELKGDVPNVVFSAANPVVGGTVYIYYGGADRVIGLATAALQDLLAFVRAGDEPAP